MTGPLEAPAPYFAEIADGPAPRAVFWQVARDGLRLRVALWQPPGARATVLLFPGRTEYLEKYAPLAGELAARGLACAALDWRGQGLSDRPGHPAMIGHVARFDDFQQDVAVLLAAAKAAAMPGRFHLLAHSMGGAIGLRALSRGLPVSTAAFTAPMWGIRLGPMLRPVAWALSTLAVAAGQGLRYAPGTGPNPYVLTEPAAGNMLTSDTERFAWLGRQLKARPELGLGGPSLQWLQGALREVRALARLPAPPLPALCGLGDHERVVDPGPIRARMARWPGGRLALYRGAEHEILMEAPATRLAFLDSAAALFGA